MDHLYRFVGIWTVFIVYIAVGVEGVAYGAACKGTGTGDCTETANIVCDTTCKCTAASFRKSTTECATKILLKAACTASQPADQCADALAVCASGNTCLCKPGNFENKAGKCVKQILLKAACTASQPADQCADALAVCASGNTCLCKPGNFENKAGKCVKQVAFNTNCGVAETASDQCVASTECKNDGQGAKKCLCKATHYENGGSCTPRIVPGASCTANHCVTHATCNTTSTKCQCETGYTATPTVKPAMCSGVMKVATLSYMLAIPIFVSMMLLLR
ncbi:uncharacterized protein LOC143046946 [Mytilus galloprovincialis]|uniref:uncharacterized protein LOC143046946 n=1 Tax=Mytilus galloprovincialis TaxID=29158 RepID=UPI003F7C6D06